VAKDAPAGKAAEKASAKKASSPRKAPAKKAAKAPATEAPAKPRPAPETNPAAERKPPVQKTRVVFPKDVYEPQKDAIKAPFKEHGLKWNYLGEGKGLYKREGVHVFAQFLDDGVHYSLWGDDKPAVAAILKAWESLLGRSFVQEAQAAGEAAQKAEEQVKESEAVRLWRLQEPQRRPGEPDFFFTKRVAEWQAKKPT
jgi:hypothetical protein